MPAQLFRMPSRLSHHIVREMVGLMLSDALLETALQQVMVFQVLFEMVDENARRVDYHLTQDDMMRKVLFRRYYGCTPTAALALGKALAKMRGKSINKYVGQLLLDLFYYTNVSSKTNLDVAKSGAMGWSFPLFYDISKLCNLSVAGLAVPVMGSKWIWFGMGSGKEHLIEWDDEKPECKAWVSEEWECREFDGVYLFYQTNTFFYCSSTEKVIGFDENTCPDIDVDIITVVSKIKIIEKH